MNLDGGFGGEIIDIVGTGDFENLGLTAGGKNEVFGGDFALVNSNGVRIEKIGVAVEADYAGIFERFFVVAASLDNGA